MKRAIVEMKLFERCLIVVCYIFAIGVLVEHYMFDDAVSAIGEGVRYIGLATVVICFVRRIDVHIIK
jgi:hypothetical protein